MFTGIITDVGKIVEIIDKPGGDRVFTIQTNFDMNGIVHGASIACSGVCLTVIEKGTNGFTVHVSNETLEKTSLGSWQVGTVVNLERSLCVGDELGGHLVFGHVDGLAVVMGMEEDGDSTRFILRAPHGMGKFLVPKGSVALDGISLTVNEVDGNMFGVNIIPHTWQETNLQYKAIGDRLNFEPDMLARYVLKAQGLLE